MPSTTPFLTLGLLVAVAFLLTGAVSASKWAPWKSKSQKTNPTSAAELIAGHGSCGTVSNRGLLPHVHRSITKSAGEFMATIGFSWSVLVGIFNYESQYRQLKPTIDALQQYLHESGISQELGRSLSAKMFDNLVVLWRIQRRYREAHDVRNVAVLRKGESIVPNMAEAARFMRYATAVYGDHMIQGVRLKRRIRGTGGSKFMPSTRERIGEHVGVDPEDVLIMDVDFAGDREHLHHFVAVDHRNKVVVLSIRGTFSLSDLVVDAAAFSKPFSGGEAHAHFVEKAERTWQEAEPHILKALRENENYSFIVTGHSLGASVACLVNILCHQRGRERVLGRQSRCFAYGCPPCYTPIELISDAVANTKAFIHGNDIVPFLSVGSVRRLVSTLVFIEEELARKRRQFFGWSRLAAITKDMPKRNLESIALQQTSFIAPKIGAPLLTIPASVVVWTRETGCGQFDYKVCDPKKISLLGIQISKQALGDHALSSYEDALHYLEQIKTDSSFFSPKEKPQN